ncbi:MAG TPA: hypothetical protein VLA19_27920 [Herpetosiphonaceae bacterium]|nr:hypothetical protein [Herpetosiphonaceae bacterium]
MKIQLTLEEICGMAQVEFAATFNRGGAPELTGRITQSITNALALRGTRQIQRPMPLAVPRLSWCLNPPAFGGPHYLRHHTVPASAYTLHRSSPRVAHLVS